MTTKDRIHTYKQLMVANQPEAERFLEANREDKVFIALVELRREIVPAFVEAGRVLRRESAARMAAYAALVETEMVRAWARSGPVTDEAPPAYIRAAAQRVAPRLEEVHLETCDAFLEAISH